MTVTEVMYTAYLNGSLKLDKLGQWWHEGRQFENGAVISLFDRSIVWDPVLSQYFVQIGQQRASFDCEDTAYHVLTINDKPAPWILALNDGSLWHLDPSTLSIGDHGQFYCQVKNGHRARLSRSAHQVLLQHAVDDNTLEIAGHLVQLDFYGI